MLIIFIQIPSYITEIYIILLFCVASININLLKLCQNNEILYLGGNEL